jgi:hypothetical protein
VPASRLGYRVTAKFVRTFLGRVFDHPDRVFDEAYLKPETQDLEAFVDGIDNITEAQQKVALQAFEDGSIEDACPPLRALLSIMAHGTFDGLDVHDRAVRQMFSKEHLLGSDWYQQRLVAKCQTDEGLWQRHVSALDSWLRGGADSQSQQMAEVRRRREYAVSQLARVRASGYLAGLQGSLGVDPSLYR